MEPEPSSVLSPESADLDPARVEDLLARARREVDAGHIPAFQLALARNGRVGVFESYGRVRRGGSQLEAGPDTLFVMFSCTKAIVSAAAWLLMQDGQLSPDEVVAEIVPQFGTHGKDAVRVEQLLTHTAGFPNAPHPQREWGDRARRLERFSSWRLEFPPGSRFFYHATSSLWVVAEIIERRTGLEIREFVRERIATPLGLQDLWLGLPAAHHRRLADIEYLGEEMSPAEREASGIPEVPVGEVTEEAVTNFNGAAVREAGVPGGGGIATAADLCSFYQGLLGHLANTPWKPETLSMACALRTEGLTDPFLGVPVRRGLGVVVAGDGDARVYNGFGRTGSARMFGHGGAGGQIGWADPETGLSFAFLTCGFDRHALRQARRGVALSSRAALCPR